jgi:drug/metabolite transporter (DMT)-like permease
MTPSATIARLEALPPEARAALLMIAAGAFLAAMHALVRYASADLHPFEIAFFRNLFGFCFFVPWLIHRGLRVMHTRRIGTHLVRAAFNATSMLIWFMALSLIPLADATALSLTGPLFVTLGSIFFLGETVRARRWLALGIGAAGALVIVRPGFETMSLGVILTLVSAMVAACTKLFAKSLSRTDGAATISAYVALLMTPITLVPALFVWQAPGWDDIAVLVLMGGLGSIGHLCFVKAYALADLSFAETIVFTRLVWAALFGYLLFAEVPDEWTWAGAAIIVAATSYIAHRERRVAEGTG